ncbi:MAG: GTPase Era [Desulfobulbaceae bacterium]|nr:GTPase Era [Desulfobulbaceae bacterium]MDY0351465.1 GTPase Era [Desulfobulbaceae bacterium]
MTPFPLANNAHGDYRSGVVAIIGPPNAGKSTLLNYFIGQKIAIVTPRPQTTRNRILGILTGESYQIILLDTPGLHQPRALLNREMVRTALDTLAEADVVLFLADATVDDPERLEEFRGEFSRYLGNIRCPVILALNKVDLRDKETLPPLLDWYASLYPFSAAVFLSALSGEGTGRLLDELVRFLPPGPMYFPEDMPTDATERFIAAEIIREKIFLLAREEVPYSTAVMIDSFQESPDDRAPVVIHATILVEQPSQKGILIGRQGRMLAAIRKQAVPDIEEMLGRRVTLHLWVKVKKKWSKNERILRELGLSK